MIDGIIKKKNEKNNTIKKSILEFENIINKKMPKSLEEFYLKYDGASIYLIIFQIDGYEYEVSKILPLFDGECSVYEFYKMDREDGIIRDTLIPFARNRGGDYYYWDTNDYKVYILYGDDIENEILISDTMDGFFELLENNIYEE